MLRALARLLRDLPDIDADEAHRRLARLTDEQRFVLEGALARLADDETDEREVTPFSSETAATLERLRREEGCHWEVTLPREDAGRFACILRWPDRVVRSEGRSAEEAMRVALRAAGIGN